MKVTLVCTGKTNELFINEGIDFYLKRIKMKLPFDIKYIPESKKSARIPVQTIKDQEAEAFFQELDPGDFLILLDDKGKHMTSMEFAMYLNKKFNMSYKRIVFMAGGARGFGESIYKRANEKLSLSKMTFPHHLVRIIFLEQLYRGLSILHNEPYHNE